MDNRTGLILCGFPGIGKTATQSLTESEGNFGFIDAESSPFRWVQLPNGNRSPNRDFPDNYIDFIEDCAGKYRVTMTAMHKQVRDEMKRRGLAYIIVAPEKNLKDEYLLRYVARGSDMGLIEQIYDHWDEWLDELEKDGAPVIHLKSGQFLADVIVPERIRLRLRKEDAEFVTETSNTIDDLRSFTRRLEELRKDGWYLQRTVSDMNGCCVKHMDIPRLPKEDSNG